MPNPAPKPNHGRRSFFKLCVGAVTASQLRQSFASAKTVNKYNRVELVDSRNNQIFKDGLEIGHSYIFHYPFVTTPCFLIDLGEPISENLILSTEKDGEYTWTGGVGPNKSIVAFAAICAHRMTHPAKSVSFINYRHGTINYQDKNHQTRNGSNLISCCSERSVYDVKRGAQVVGGPAPQPLTTILLDYDQANDKLYAAGTSGGELYDRFFADFTQRLQLEYQILKVDNLATDSTMVVRNEDFSRTLMTC